jgi:hypothetical protein
MTKKVCCLHARHPLFLSDFNKTQFFLKNTQISNFMKIRSERAELFLAHGRTDGRKDQQKYMTNLAVAFRNFSNAPTREEIGK